MTVSVRFNVMLSNDLNRAIDDAAEQTESDRSEIMRKALQLYLAAREGKSRGKKPGLVVPGETAAGNRDRRFVSLIDLNTSPPNHKFSVSVDR